METKLNAEEIKLRLESKPLWNVNDRDELYRELVAPSFTAAIGLTNAIAIAAEAMGHHPDILVYGWNKVRVSVRTHTVDGLTELDFALAEKIDEIAG